MLRAQKVGASWRFPGFAAANPSPAVVRERGRSTAVYMVGIAENARKRVEDGAKGDVINCETTTHMQDTCWHMLSTSKLLFLLGLCDFCHSPYCPHSSYFYLGAEGEPKVPESAAEGPVWVTLTL